MNKYNKYINNSVSVTFVIICSFVEIYFGVPVTFICLRPKMNK